MGTLGEHHYKPKKNRFRWALTIGLLIGTLCVTAFAFMYDLPTIYKYETDSKTTTTEHRNYAFLSVATLNEEASSPYLKTGFDNTFFSVDKNNKVVFFEFIDSKFTKLKTSQTFNISLTHKETEAQIKISLLEKDGVVEGYGIYKNPNSVKFPYAFVKVTKNFLLNNDKTSYDYLIYVDYSIDDFYKNEKTYSMVYAFDSKTNDLKKLLSDKGIPTGKNGLPSDNFILIPGDFAGLETDGIYFLTDRSYAPGTKFDLYRKTDIESEPTCVYKNIIAPHLFCIDKTVCFFIDKPETVTEDETTISEFDLCKISDGKTKTIRTFSGTPDQYSIRGNYMFAPSSKTLYNISTGDSNGLLTSISISRVQDFTLNSDGTKIALAGNFIGNSEKLLFYNFQNERIQIVDGSDLFISNIPNLSFVDDSVFMVMPSENTNMFSNFVISWDAIFSLT